MLSALALGGSPSGSVHGKTYFRPTLGGASATPTLGSAGVGQLLQVSVQVVTAQGFLVPLQLAQLTLADSQGAGRGPLVQAGILSGSLQQGSVRCASGWRLHRRG